MVYYTSDQHFGHRNIIRYCNRPYSSVFEMNNYLMAYWNNMVKPTDTIYHLGDFGFGPKSVLKNLLSKLNGYKILILGNHDKSMEGMKEVGFNEVYQYMEFNINKKRIFLSHVPMVSIYHDIVICGHVHDKFKINGNIVNVGVDVWNYRPVSLETILSLSLDRRNIKYMDIEIEQKENN